VRLGEALAKCQHITYVALPPAVSADLHQLYMIKGTLSSAQIEGNSLTEDQAIARAQGELTLPPSQEYQGQELDNLRHACEMVVQEVAQGGDARLTTERIKQFNTMVLSDQPSDPDVIPGEIRTRGVTVGSVYKGPPAGDCEYLLDQLCAWLDQLQKDAAAMGPEWLRSMGIVRAVLAHLYLAWIHPFGDGNGRTARLIEFQLLMAAGFPTPACHLLSNYYNKTRSRYYQVLRETSAAKDYPAWRFASYAIQGFAEELSSQLELIQRHQLGLAWKDLIFGVPLGRSDTADRRRQLLLSLIPGGVTDFTSITWLRQNNADIAVRYASKDKTLTRDINALEQSGLVERHADGDGIRPRFEQLFAFLPIRKIPVPEPDEKILQSLAAASQQLDASTRR
jgi:Fic family protein